MKRTLFFLTAMASALLALASCRSAKNISSSSAEKECAELYGELETKEIQLEQRMIRFFGFDSSVLPKDDTVMISVPNKINHNIICWDPSYYFYYNDALVYISDEPSLAPELKEALHQRIKDAWKRIFFHSDGEKFFVPETTITEGIDENGLCWKKVNFEFMSYGYVRVPPKHKWYFDRILESFHKKTPSYQEVFEKLSKTL